MELLPRELRKCLPPLYSQEKTEDPIVHIKFFTPDSQWTWYVTEGSEDDDDFLFFGYVVGAYLTDILGRRKSFFLFAICSTLTVLAYMFIPVSDSVLLVLGAPLGFFASGIYSGIGAFFSELYPTRIRGSGIGFCFNIGRAIGALFPTLVGLLSATMPLGEAIGTFTVAAYGLIIVAAALLPETNGRSLAAT